MSLTSTDTKCREHGSNTEKLIPNLPPLLLSKLSWCAATPLLLLSVLAIFTPQLAVAQTASAPLPSPEPLELELLGLETSPPGRDLITANTISPTGLSTPSLWWAKEQFNEMGGKLINNWIAYQDNKRIDLVVNAQLWTLLDYIERYRFINKFGTVASHDYQYDVRVFNQQGLRLATYTCDYTLDVPQCEIQLLNSFGQDSLPVPRQ